MTHKWLTEKEVEQIEKIVAKGWPANIGNQRLIADWREMRELLLSCEAQLPACTRDREDIEDMREATADD